jgi:hypothetical protein
MAVAENGCRHAGEFMDGDCGLKAQKGEGTWIGGLMGGRRKTLAPLIH